VIASLREFIGEMGQGPHLTIILDNAPWHKKAVRLVQGEAWPEYQDIRDRVALCFLPPYSPDLNPIEQCWRITRREVTHNVYHKGIASLTESLDQYFAKYRDPNQKMVSLCSFKYKD
jgi:transposase